MNAAESIAKRDITVRPDASVGEIAGRLLNHKINAVPVIDADRHVVRIASKGDSAQPSALR
jgi:CBS domain-containing protein